MPPAKVSNAFGGHYGEYPQSADWPWDMLDALKGEHFNQ